MILELSIAPAIFTLHAAEIPFFVTLATSAVPPPISRNSPPTLLVYASSASGDSTRMTSFTPAFSITVSTSRLSTTVSPDEIITTARICGLKIFSGKSLLINSLIISDASSTLTTTPSRTG